jgi:type VI secretion system secreted protein Hcp
MALSTYMWLKDDQDSEIKGSVQIAGREGSCEVIELHHNLHIPTDPHDGTLRGRRMHGQFETTKILDAASTYLYKACCEGQTLKEVMIKWYTIDDTGTEKELFIVTMSGVKVASIEADLPNTKNPSNEHLPPCERVGFAYNKIEWKFCEGQLAFTDSWTTQG